ncbi:MULTISPECIES: hypothetical protein [Yersiniaceae]|nr:MULTISPECIES: hypothetical protein [Yersiniaceae]MDV5142367.1 hypothetical protein [Chimaeribacter arupi]WKZ91280.1 hypothetical protein P0E69_13715 [Chimaeribacter arupi]
MNNVAKKIVIGLVSLMALGAIGGVMLAGYAVLIGPPA